MILFYICQRDCFDLMKIHIFSFPAAKFASLFFNEPLMFIDSVNPYYLFIYDDLYMKIGEACSGFTFFCILTISTICLIDERVTNNTAKIKDICLLLLVCYFLTILTNGLRILLISHIELYLVPLLSFQSKGLTHLLPGSMIFSLTTIIYYLVLNKAYPKEVIKISIIRNTDDL